MKISALESTLKLLRENHGDLEVLIESPTGIFVNIGKTKIKYILCYLDETDEYKYISGNDFLILTTKIEG